MRRMVALRPMLSALIPVALFALGLMVVRRPEPVVPMASAPAPALALPVATSQPAIVEPHVNARPLARHVIIVSEDGMRPDALLGDDAPFHRWLMEVGAYSLNAQTIRNASTLPSHAAMLSGFDVHDHGLFWNSWQPHRGFIKVPTVLDSAMQAGNGAAAFVGKKKLAHIIKPGVVDVFARPGYLCRKIVDAALEYFVEHRPQIEFVHFSDPDSGGHKYGWMSKEQMRNVRSADRCLEKLIEGVAASDLAEDTLVIVSSDHGGHGRGHSGRHREDRTIPWLVWGASVRRGHRIVAEVSTVDTAATTLWALGLTAPAGLAGRPVTEAFRVD